MPDQCYPSLRKRASFAILHCHHPLHETARDRELLLRRRIYLETEIDQSVRLLFPGNTDTGVFGLHRRDMTLVTSRALPAAALVRQVEERAARA